MQYTSALSKRYSAHKGKYRSTNTYVLPVLNKLDLKNKTVLDFGYGDGSDSDMFLEKKAREIIGVDNSQAMICLAEQRYKGKKSRRGRKSMCDF